MPIEKKPYRTTAQAGYFVANQRIPSARDGDGNRIPKVGHILRLTEEEARYELLQGTIEPAGEAATPAPLAPPKKPRGDSSGASNALEPEA